MYQSVIRDMVVPSRLNIIAHFSESAEPYPINMLRNIAIDGVQTSHFWLADMDMWPAGFVFRCFSRVVDLYETLISLPREFLQRDDTATIVPSFEYVLPKDVECTTFTGCINKYASVCCVTCLA